MSMRRLMATLALVLALASSTKADAVADELAKFQGTWRLVSVEADGKVEKDLASKNITVTIEKETHTVRFGDSVIESNVKFAIDPSKTPKEVTDTVMEGPNKGQVIKGIYKLEGDMLTSCTSSDGERPTEFSAPAGSKRTVRTFERLVDDPNKKDLAFFEGTWDYESMIVDGNEAPADDVKGSRLVLEGETFTLKTPGGDMVGTFKIDATKSPKTIDATFSDGPQKGMVTEAIYEVDGKTFKVCSSTIPGSPRPTKFESKAGSGHVLQVLKKEKP